MNNNQLSVYDELKKELREEPREIGHFFAGNNCCTNKKMPIWKEIKALLQVLDIKQTGRDEEKVCPKTWKEIRRKIYFDPQDLNEEEFFQKKNLLIPQEFEQFVKPIEELNDKHGINILTAMDQVNIPCLTSMHEYFARGMHLQSSEEACLLMAGFFRHVAVCEGYICPRKTEISNKEKVAWLEITRERTLHQGTSEERVEEYIIVIDPTHGIIIDGIQAAQQIGYCPRQKADVSQRLKNMEDIYLNIQTASGKTAERKEPSYAMFHDLKEKRKEADKMKQEDMR